MFQKAHYKESENHIGQHEKFVEKVEQFIKDFDSGEATLSFELIDFLKQWLVNHILKIDAKYVPTLKEHGIN